MQTVRRFLKQVVQHFSGNQKQHNAEGFFEFGRRKFVGGFDTERGKGNSCRAEDGDGGQVKEAQRPFGQSCNIQTVDQIRYCAGECTYQARPDDVPMALWAGKPQWIKKGTESEPPPMPTQLDIAPNSVETAVSPGSPGSGRDAV